MRRNVHPVEELFALRAEIRTLKAREAALRAHLLRPASRVERCGPVHEVVISRQTRRVLLRDRLPREIHTDPNFWDLRVSEQLQIRRRSLAPASSGFAAPRLPAWAAKDDPLFEPFG